MHKLLRIQLKKHFGVAPTSEAVMDEVGEKLKAEAASDALAGFLASVDAAYDQFDRDVSLAHRGLVLSNQELVSLYERQRTQLEARQRVLDSLRESVREMAGATPDQADAGDDLESLSKLVRRLVREREEARVALVQAQKLEGLASMAGGIAHEFNNLLVALNGNLEMGLLRLEGNHPARVHMESMEPAAARATAIVRQLLDYAGKGRLQFQAFDINGLARELEHLIPASSRTHVRIVHHLAPDPLMVRADLAQMRQALTNLLLNALDAIGEAEGTVSLTTELTHLDREDLATCQVSEAEAGTFVAIHLQDSGAGMDEATLGRLFDPFFSTKALGRGLGLAVLHGVLRNHRGAARVRSRVGSGTCVSLYFPRLAELVSGPGPMPSTMPARSSKGTVLVVDDEAPNRTVMAAFLDSLGYQHEEVGGGREAMARCEKRPGGYDAVLLDLSMPGMDGVETLMALRRMVPDLKVILVSGFSEDLSRNRLDGLAVSGFMQKPFRVRELGDCLERVLRS